MSSYQMAVTDAPPSIDHRLRMKRMEMQLSILASAVRVLAQAVEEYPPSDAHRSAVVKQVEAMLHDAQL